MVRSDWRSADSLTRFVTIGQQIWFQEKCGRRQYGHHLVEIARDDEKESITLCDRSQEMYYLVTSSASYWGPVEAFQSQPAGGGLWNQHVSAGGNGWIPLGWIPPRKVNTAGTVDMDANPQPAKPEPDTVRAIKQQLNSLDSTDTGKMTVDELSFVLCQLGLSDLEANVITKEMVCDGNGRIDVNFLVDWVFKIHKK